MEPFDFKKNRKRVEEKVNEHIKLAGIKDPEGFTLVGGFIAPPIQPVLSDDMPVGGRTLSHVAVVGNKTGIVHYFALDILFPEENFD